MKTIELPTATDDQLLLMLRAVANPVRYRILQLLRERGSCQCGPLNEAFPIAASTLSQHLKVLREAGLIQGIIDGPYDCYCRNETTIAWLQEQMQQV